MTFDNVILGQGAVYSTDSNVTGINNNRLIIGGSGSGKTFSIVEPRLLEAHHSNLVITLTKRRLLHKYRKFLEKRGYNVLDMNFVSPSDSDIAYDPLCYVRSFQDVQFLAESIVMSNPKKKDAKLDPYWDDASISLLCAEILYILETMGPKKASFADVLALHDRLTFSDTGSQIRTSLDDAFEALADKNPKSLAVNCWKTFSMTPAKTAGCIFSTLNTTIDTIFFPDLRKMIANKKKLSFEKLASEKTVLFVSTSAVNPALHCFVNLFYSQMFKQLFEIGERNPDGKLPIPIEVICDDFATGSKINNFVEYISIFREKQISVTMLLQSESQLDYMYGSNESTSIVNNCDTYVYLGSMDLKTGRCLSERLNKPLEDVLYMPIGQIAVIRRGQRPLMTQRYDIQSDRRHQELIESSDRNRLA